MVIRAFFGLLLLGIVCRPAEIRAQEVPARDGAATSGTLTFESLLSHALAHDPALAAIDAGIEAARGKTTQAGLLPNPRLRYHMSNYDLDRAGSGAEDHGLRLMQPLAIGGRLRRAVTAGEAERLAAEALRRQREFELEGELRLAWRLAVYDWGSAEAMQAWFAALAESRAIAERRVKEGSIPPVELGAVDWEIQRMQAARDEALGRMQEGLAAVAGLSGVAALRPAQLALPPAPSAVAIEEIPDLDQARAREQAGSRHPALLAAEASVELARRELEVTRAERVPDLEIGGGVGRSRDTNSNQLEFLVEMDVPIFDRNQGKIREGKARVEQAGAELDEARRELLTQYDQLCARLVAARARDAYLRRTAIPRNEEIFAKTGMRFREGADSFDDYFDAQRELLRSRLDALNTGRDVTETYYEVLRLGGLGAMNPDLR